LEIPHPPLATQQKIVAKLDAIFTEIDKATAAAEANAKNAEALFQSYLTEVFERAEEGWNKKKISEIAKIKGGKRVPKGYELKNEITPYVYLRVTNFSENGDIDTTDLRYVDSDVWSGIKNYIINSEDLYVSIAGTIGRTGMVSEQLSGSLLTENACRLVFNNDINNRFVYYFTKSSSFISQTVEQTRTTAQPKLALSRLGEITLAIPSLDEQLKINKKLDLMTSQISIYKNSYEQKIIELNALKQAILQKAFSGELVKV
jgi:type I restriction enzyme S subunit